MIKNLIVIFAILLLGIVMGFIAGLNFPRAHLYVEVELKNNSSQDILSIELTHKEGACRLKDLKKGQHESIRFFPIGESSYSIIVQFTDGTRIEGGETYVESGYRITETITDSKITSDTQLY